MGYLKQLNLLKYAISNVQVYRRRTISILVFFCIVISLLISIDILREGIKADAIASTEFSPDILIQGYQGGRTVPVDNKLMNDIKSIDGTAIVTSRVWGYLSAADRLYTLMGINVSEYPLDNEALDFNIKKGRFLTEEDNETLPVCVLGSGVAEASRAQIGSILLLTDINNDDYELEVVGIFSVSSKIYTHDLIMTTIDSSRKYFGIPENKSTDICVWQEENKDRLDIIQEIDETIDDVRIIEKELMKNLLIHSTNERAGFYTVVWFILLLGSLLFAFSISSSVSLEARKEVGILKSIGYSTMDILTIRTMEYAITGFIASTIGITISIAYVFYLGAPILADFMLGWSVLFPVFILPIRLTIDIVLVAYGLGIIPLIVASVIPAWKNAIDEPDKVMRGI